MAKVWLVYVHPDHRPVSDADVRGWLLNEGKDVSVDDEIVVREERLLPADGALYVFDVVALQRSSPVWTAKASSPRKETT